MAFTRRQQAADINAYIADLEDCVEEQAMLIRLLDGASLVSAPDLPRYRRIVTETRAVIAGLLTRLALDTEQEAR